MSVPTQTPTRRPFPLLEFVRASSLHVGAAAARLPGGAFEAYAVARVTPGTNLLAMYTLLGERFAASRRPPSWRYRSRAPSGATAMLECGAPRPRS